MKKALQSFFLNLILAIIVIAPFMISGKGILAITNDFNFQTIDFGIAINDAIKSGNGLWSPTIDLGSDIVSVYSWNNIASPFYIWTLLFPADLYPYLIGYAYMIKYAVAGLTSYLLFAYFLDEDKKNWAIAGSVLYAFCGFQCVNMIFQFHDVVALFPLMMLAVEKKADRFNECDGCGKNTLTAGFGFLAISVMLNGITNYFMFVSEVVFFVIYFVIRFLMGHRVQSKVRFLFATILESIVGAMLGAFILLPAYVGILANSRVAEHMWGGILQSNREYLRLLCAILLPAEPMTSQCYITEQDYSSYSCFIPVIGLALVACFIYRYLRCRDREYRDKYRWMMIIIIICVVCMIIPFFNNMFTLWSTDYYRWFFLPTLMFILCSVVVLSEYREYPITQMSLVFAGITLLLGAFLKVWDVVRVKTVFDESQMWMNVGSVVIRYVLLSLIPIVIKNKRLVYTAVLTLAAVSAVIYNAQIIARYKEFNYESAEEYYDKIAACRQFELPEFGRVDVEEFEDSNLALAAGLPGRITFSSTVSGKIMDFYEDIGLERKVFTPIGPEGTGEVLSIRYLLSADTHNELKTVDEAEYRGTHYYLYEYDKYLPMGIIYDSYITESEYDNVSPKDKSRALLSFLVIGDEDSDKVSGMAHGDISEISGIDIDALVDARLAGAQYIESDYSSATIECDHDGYVFFSIPNDPGWSAYVNGEKTDIITDAGGLMAVGVKAGYNEINLVYESVYFRYGVVISIIGLAIMILLICVKRKY